MNRLLSVLTAAILFCCAATLATAATVTYSDDFTTAHDYLTEGTAGTIWDGALNAGNLIVANTTATPGTFTAALSDVAGYGWDSTHVNAPFLYKEVSSAEDFTARMKLQSATNAAYVVAGLLVYKDDSNFVGANANFFGEKYFQGRSIAGGVQTDTIGTDGGVFGTAVPLYLKFGYKAATSTLNYWASTNGSTWSQVKWGQ